MEIANVANSLSCWHTRFNEDRLNLKIWMASFHTWGLERLASNTWKIKGKSWVQYGDHVVAFFFFFDNWYFSTLYAINFVHSLKGIREIEWWLNRWDLKIFIYLFIFCKLWVGMLIIKIWTLFYRLCCFSEKTESKLKVVSTVFNYKYLVWESCKILRVSWASQYSFKQWANKSTKRNFFFWERRLNSY